MKESARSRARIVLKACLSQCGPEKKRALEKFLPDDERRSLETLPDLEHEIDVNLFSNSDLLTKVHWSWFLPTLKLYPESEQKLFLAILGPFAEKNLARALTLSISTVEITDIAKSFLTKTLLDGLLGPKDWLLPSRYLPKSPMNQLLKLSKKELTHLIDQLSLFDLAIELRQIVETKILKKTYSLLTEEEKKRLKDLAAHKEPFSFGKLGLDRWDGLEESLRTLLHKRGLVRLGAGLSGQDPDLIWYICHQLDIGRGAQLHKLCIHEPVHGVTEVILKQIEEHL